MKEIKCCICGNPIDEEHSNNPEGALGPGNVLIQWDEGDRCCDSCNLLYVIPGRLYAIKGGKD